MILPIGWQLKLVGDLFFLQLGKMLNKDAQKITPQFFYLGNSNVQWGGFELNELKKMHFNEKDIIKFSLKKNDILMCEGGEVGRCAIWDRDDSNIFYQKAIHRLRSKGEILPQYFQNYMQKIAQTKLLEDFTTKTSIAHLTQEKLALLPVYLPPLQEQQKIAQILSTWDQAIAVTESLLENSQQQKKALMQQLLTGKKRLLDENGVRFDGEWQEYAIGDLGNTYTGLTGKTKEDFGHGVPFITYMNIFKNNRIDVTQVDYVTIQEDENQNSVQYGDIFFTTSSETAEEVGMSSVLLDEVKKMYLNSFCFGFRLNDFQVLLPQFAVYILRSSEIRKQISTLGQGATRYNLSKNQLMKLTLALPPIEEQNNIATVLSTADQGIQALQQKLDCLKQEKKALMQQLLTGKRRVKVAA